MSGTSPLPPDHKTQTSEPMISTDTGDSEGPREPDDHETIPNQRNDEAEIKEKRKRRQENESEENVKISKSQLQEAFKSGKFTDDAVFKREEIRDAMLRYGLLGFDEENLGFHRLWAKRKSQNLAVRDIFYDVPIAKEELTEDEKSDMTEHDLESYFDVPVNGRLLGQTDTEIFSLSNLYRHALSGQPIRMSSGLFLTETDIDRIFRLGKLCFGQKSRGIWKGRCRFCLSDLKFEETNIGICTNILNILGEIFNVSDVSYWTEIYRLPVITVKRLCASTGSEDIVCHILAHHASESKSMDHKSSVAQYLLQRAWEKGILLVDSEYDDTLSCGVRFTRPRYTVECLNDESESSLYMILNSDTICEQINRLSDL